MMSTETFQGPEVPRGFYWFNPPKSFYFEQGLSLTTDRDTDFWQRTHYGFRRDNGHCLFTRIEGDFSVSLQTRFDAKSQYDQCGLMIRSHAEQWIKVSTEYEDATLSRLGSVVTNRGYSDWATQDVSSVQTERWYRVERQGNDFMLDSAEDGEQWKQMRIAHLYEAPRTLEVGLYACSPSGEGFRCRFPAFHWRGAVSSTA